MQMVGSEAVIDLRAVIIEKDTFFEPFPCPFRMVVSMNGNLTGMMMVSIFVVYITRVVGV